MVRKVLQKEAVKRKMPVTQADFVLDYLLGAGRRGATNFEMMMNLHICDVRKRITELNRDEDCEYFICSVWEQSEQGQRYKRYYAVPWTISLEAFLNGKKNTPKARSIKRNTRRR